MLHRIKYFCLIAAALALVACGETPDGENTGEVYTAEPDLPVNPTFWEHAAPIVFENCTPCHHNGGAGPFPLVSYDDSRKRTKTIRKVVETNFMPPWPADPGYRTFKNEKRLSPAKKALLLHWIDKGAEEGTPPKDPPVPRLHTDNRLGEPDLVLEFPDTIRLGGDNVDKFFIAKIPFELKRDTNLAAVDFRPGNKWLVHHVNGHLINYGEGKKTDVYGGEWNVNSEKVTSLEAYQRMQLQNDDGTYPPLLVSAMNYLPGVEPTAYPEGLGTMRIAKKGAFLLNTLHYGPSALDTFDFSRIELYFAKSPPERPMQELHLGTLGVSPVVPEFVIPAGKISDFTTEYRVPQDISVLTINPHMHLLGKTFRAYAYSPASGDTIPMIDIPRWDFRWQFFYTYEKMLHIPKGYVIRVEATFDNTADNPFNPNDPPKTLFEAGRNMKTTDEMFQFFVNFVPYRKGDEHIEL